MTSRPVRKLTKDEAERENETPLSPEEAWKNDVATDLQRLGFLPDSEPPDDSIESRHQRFSRVFKRRKSDSENPS
ncbi:MAG: hypothetical protein RMM16_00570 [Chloroherpetonaceae bacterium]|nr:hypothetical protein [Chloroherpetonaceae bacterium]